MTSIAWEGSIQLQGSHGVSPLNLTLISATDENQLATKTTLIFLSVVDIDRIPLNVFVGTQYQVQVNDSWTEQWLEDTIAHRVSQQHDPCNTRDSHLGQNCGILIGLRSGTPSYAFGHKITELLLYSSNENEYDALLGQFHSTSGVSHSTSSQFRVIAICSDLLYRAPVATPPASPRHESEDVIATFLPAPEVSAGEIVNQLSVKKRRSAVDTFDEANQRRKKARQQSRESGSSAIANKAEDAISGLLHRRSVSGTSIQQPQSLGRLYKPLSRSPSISATIPMTASGRTVSDNQKRSSLSLVEAAAGPSGGKSNVEVQNKDLISRTVMAGMRLHGLTQNKSRDHSKAEVKDQSRENSSLICENQPKSTFSDEDFKIVYHQVYKGTTCAFRRCIATTMLQSHTEAVRDTVDRLLGIFCSDPLIDASLGIADELTPGGRRAFGQRSVRYGQLESSPFVDARSKLDHV